MGKEIYPQHGEKCLVHNDRRRHPRTGSYVPTRFEDYKHFFIRVFSSELIWSQGEWWTRAHISAYTRVGLLVVYTWIEVVGNAFAGGRQETYTRPFPGHSSRQTFMWAPGCRVCSAHLQREQNAPVIMSIGQINLAASILVTRVTHLGLSTRTWKYF